MKPWKKALFLMLGLTLFLMTAPLACKNREAPADANRQELDFYTGRQIAPLHSRSHVEKWHSKYVFEPVLQGDIVKHDFIFKNDSDEVLELTDAEGCCGTLVESFTQVIPPDQSGKISILVLTDSRGGQEINGTIRAKTNDKEHPEITIDMSIYVKEFAALHPYRVWLKGSAQEEVVEKCIVIPNEDYPFEITEIKTRKGVWFDYTYKQIEIDGKKAYEITLRNTREKPGPYQDVLFVQTDSSVRPEFKIRVEGRISS